MKFVSIERTKIKLPVSVPTRSALSRRPSINSVRTAERSNLRKYLTLGVRLLQFILATTVCGIFIKLLSQRPAHMRSEMGVLLAFSLITAIQSVSAATLTIMERERLFTIALDVACICGYVTTAVLLRSITTGYNCQKWLSTDDSPHQHIPGLPGGAYRLARRAHEPEPSQCSPLRGVFGIAVVGCVLLLLSFQLELFTLRAKKVERMRAEGRIVGRKGLGRSRGVEDMAELGRGVKVPRRVLVRGEPRRSSSDTERVAFVSRGA